MGIIFIRRQISIYRERAMRDCIVLLGRAGLEYHDEQGIKYFVDSELCMGDEYDYAIFKSQKKYCFCARRMELNLSYFTII